MEKRRVYQVAKDKKLSSDALISMLKTMGHEVKSHMSVVTEDMLNAITGKIEEEKKSSIEEVQRQRQKEESRKKEAAKARRERESPAPAGAGGKAVGGGGAGSKTIERIAADGAARGGTVDGRRRRRGKRDDGPAVARAESGAGTANRAAPRRPGAPPPPGVGGRGRGGGGQRRRPKVDAQSVQDTVRKTLSQIAEGRTRKRYDRGAQAEGEEGSGKNELLPVREFSTVGELAEQMGCKPGEVIAACLELGVVVNINQRLDMDTIVTVADEFGFEAKPLEEEEELLLEEPDDDEDVGTPEPRSPVVTVMGHVDHGKTSLLDYLRNSNVAAGESGGITQHIGAYVVHSNDRAVTFLDTPGHAAFTAMRARGARVTDLVILVVAADDSVMPQTIEAIDHAKAAGAPVVVAINKIDLPTADVDRIKRELGERGVLLEDWGGKVPCAEISAKTGTGIDKLLELVLLEAELKELTATPERRARGTIIEAKLDKGRGPVATVLVQEGTLRVGDPFVTGIHGGRVRALLDEHLSKTDIAGPSMPVQVLGLSGVPQAGDTFSVTATERESRDIVLKRQQMKREQDSRHTRAVTLGDLHYQIQEGKIKELNVVVKGDVDGSVEAINQELGGITHEEVRIAIIHSAVGPISESDVLLASASNAIIIGFGVPTETTAREMAVQSSVDIRNYSIIYEVVEELRAALSGLLSPKLDVQVIGEVQVRQVFSSSRTGNIAGCMVRSGKITRNNRVRVMRAGENVFEGDIASLRRFKDDVREVLEGYECGVGLEGWDDIAEEDVVEVLEVVESVRTL